MANVLNKFIANTPINNPSMQAKPAYTIDTTGKVKPLEDKAKLLPSRIFGSPKEYLKDIKQDVLNIGKAAKGKANDHELGRINDLAMKAGAGALAAYLFIKNPLKLGKAMEIIGAGSFFATMALWPKLAIQAPIKARTGVDIHQKYIDSQGRKKMLHQDPQYDLTDLYSRQDLDNMGKKLDVDENLPDRDRFIKQRAKKTAIQGNTLWMMTAGLATPIGSALMCNALEQPVSAGIENANLALSSALNSKLPKEIAGKANSALDKANMTRFCQQHANETLSNEMINDLATRMTKGLPIEIRDAVSAEIKQLSASKITVESIDSIFEACGIEKEIIEGIDISLKEEYLNKILSGDKRLLGLTKKIRENGGDPSKIKEAINNAKQSTMSVGQIQDKLENLSKILGEARAKNKIINKYAQERIGDVQNSHIANQWGRTTQKFVKSLGFSDKELKQIAKGKDNLIKQKLFELGVDNAEINSLLKGKTKVLENKLIELNVSPAEIKKLLSVDVDLIESKLQKLADNSEKATKVKGNILTKTNRYNRITGEKFTKTLRSKVEELFDNTGKQLTDAKFDIVAEAFNNRGFGGVSDSIVKKAQDRATGARGSFYRMFQAIDIREGKVIENGLRDAGIKSDRAKELTKLCKKMSLDATITDFLEKFKNCGYNLSSAGEFEAIAKVLYSKPNSFKRNEGLVNHLKEFVGKVINYNQGIVPDNASYVIGKAIDSTPAERQALVGENINNIVRDAAKNLSNSRTWLKITGISFAVITAVTLIATLAIGKKGKTEKQVEEGNKVNG